MIKIKESVKFGWNGFKKNWPPFIILALLTAVAIGMPGEEKSLYNAHSLISDVLVAIIGFSCAVLSLKVVDGKRVSVSDIWGSYKDLRILLIFVLVSVVYSLLFQVGFILLIIPGLVLGARFFMAPYLVVDKKASFVNSFKMSWKLTQGKTIRLILFQITLGGVLILGVVALLVGVLVAFSVISVASAYVYKKLSSK